MLEGSRYEELHEILEKLYLHRKYIQVLHNFYLEPTAWMAIENKFFEHRK